MPKEVRVEPQKFAEELIHRLEAVQRTREAEEKLEERLKRVRMVSGPRWCPAVLLRLGCPDDQDSFGPDSLRGCPGLAEAC